MTTRPARIRAATFASRAPASRRVLAGQRRSISRAHRPSRYQPIEGIAVELGAALAHLAHVAAGQIPVLRAIEREAAATHVGLGRGLGGAPLSGIFRPCELLRLRIEQPASEV